MRGFNVRNLVTEITYVFLVFRLIKHTEKLLEEKEEKLCVKILNTLGEMMSVDLEYGEKVSVKFSFRNSL